MGFFSIICPFHLYRNTMEKQPEQMFVVTVTEQIVRCFSHCCVPNMSDGRPVGNMLYRSEANEFYVHRTVA